MSSAPGRQVRIDDDTWARAQARAYKEGRTLSDIMRDVVTRYADGQELKPSRMFLVSDPHEWDRIMSAVEAVGDPE